MRRLTRAERQTAASALTAGIDPAKIPEYDAELTAVWQRSHGGREDIVVIGTTLFAAHNPDGAYYAVASVEPAYEHPGIKR
jgi:hypothetical protein